MPLVSKDAPTNEALGLEANAVRERQASRTFSVLSEEAFTVPEQAPDAPEPKPTPGPAVRRTVSSLFGD